MADFLPPEKINIKNKKAWHEFEVLERYTAGLRLLGSEIKSIRQGKASIKEAFCYFHHGELFVKQMHIAAYEKSEAFFGHEERRERKLLLRKDELRKIQKKMKDTGITVIPLRLFMGNRGFAKLEIGVAKGKKLHDKRRDLKEKDLKREMERAKKEGGR
ncbi:MAG: SsrA-binding protein SmpB [Flavobacteriales bacterium]